MLEFIRFLRTRFACPPRTEHPHITALVCVGALLITMGIVTAVLVTFAH